MSKYFFVIAFCFFVFTNGSPAAEENAAESRGSSLAAIDLEKTPWLVERMGLSPTHPAFTRPRSIWADSFRLRPLEEAVKGGEIVVERWVNDEPKDFAGKYVFLEVWATWCPPCRRSLPLLNYYHEKYKDQLVVVSICETDEQALKEMKGPLKLEDIRFYLAVDTNRRFADALGVYGIPHAVLIEPVYGAVIWEGMPTLPKYELDDKTMEKILSVGQKLKESGKVPEKSPVSFKIEPADPDRKPKLKSKNVEL